MDNQHNPFYAHSEEFHGVSSRDLTNQWNGPHNPSFEDVWMNCWAASFGYSSDGMAYHVEIAERWNQRLSMKNWNMSTHFMESLAILPYEVVNRAKEDTQRGISHSIRYCTWMGYQKEDNSEPFISAQCRKNMNHAQGFSTRISSRGIVLERFCKLFSEESTRCSCPKWSKA